MPRGRELECERAGELGEGGLHRAVDGETGRGLVRLDAREVHDRTARHVGDNCSDERGDVTKVLEPQHVVALVGHIEERCEECAGCVVHEHVDRPETGDHVGDEGVARVCIAHIERAGERDGQLVEPVGDPVAHGDARAEAGEELGGRATEPAPGAGHDRDAIGQQDRRRVQTHARMAPSLRHPWLRCVRTASDRTKGNE